MRVERLLLGILAGAVVAGCGASARSAAPTVSPEAMASALTPANVVTYRGDSGRTGVMPGPGPSGSPGTTWRFEAKAPMGSSVAIANGLIYLVTLPGTLFALDRSSGVQRWKVDIGLSVNSSPSIVDGLVILGAADGVHALDAMSGAAVWTRSDLGPVPGSPAVVGDVLIAASTNGTVAALDPRTGATHWSRQVGGPVTRSVAAAEGVVILGLDGGTVLALSVADGSVVWKSVTGIPGSIGTSTIAAGRVYVPMGLGGAGPGVRHLLALDLATGRELWRYASPQDAVVYAPVLAAGLVILVSEDSTVVALQPDTGNSIWRFKAPGPIEAVPAAVGGTVYVASNGGFVLALDARSGTELWRVAIRGVPYGPVVADGRVLVATSLGELDAIGAVAP